MTENNQIQSWGNPQEICEALAREVIKEKLETGIIGVVTEERINKTIKGLGITRRTFNKTLVIVEQNERKERGMQQAKNANEIVRYRNKELDIDEEFDISGTGYSIVNNTIVDNQHGDRICNHILVFLGKMIDIEDSKEEQYLLGFNRAETPHKFEFATIKASVANSSLDFFKAASKCGMDFTSQNSSALVNYLYEYRHNYIQNIKIIKKLNRAGWHEENGKYYLMPYQANEVSVFVADDNNLNRKVGLESLKGSKEVQRELIKEVVEKCENAPILLGALISSLIVGYIDSLVIMLNLYGTSRVGKSVIMKALSSIYGDPNAFWGDGDSTNNKDKNIAAYLCNLPVIIDDPLQNRSIKPENVESEIYGIVSGENRGRMKRDGETAQKVKKWKNTIITTNEGRWITQNSKGGIISRVLEIRQKHNIGNKLGAKWIELAKKNHGHFAVDIAKEITKHTKEEIEEKIKEEVNVFNALEIYDKQGLSAATIATGYKMVQKIFGVENIKFSYELFAKNIKINGEISEGVRAYELFIKWVDTHIEQFRNQVDSRNITCGSLGYAKLDGKQVKVINIMPYTMMIAEKELGFNKNEMIYYGYNEKLFIPRYDKNGKEELIDVVIFNNKSKVYQLVYEWHGKQKSSFISNNEEEFIEVDEDYDMPF